MQVQTPGHRLIACTAVAAPFADVVGRLLAPSLLVSAPAIVVALSPADPHLLLATNESRVALVAIAFAVRLGRAWAIFRSLEHFASRPHSPVRRLLMPERNSKWRHHTGVGAVVFLPGMVGAVIAARAKLHPRLFLTVAALSTASGLAITLTASHIFEDQLARASQVLARHPTEFTLLVAAVILGGLVRRWRKHLALPQEQN